MSEPLSVSERVEREIAAGRLTFDPGQQAAAARLDALRDELSRSRSPLAGLRERFGLGAPAAETRSGVYLWGGVGRGKTLLMDFLVESLAAQNSSAPPERTHFYRFMRGVHAELGSLAGRADPLERVAQRIGKRTRILCLDELIVADIADAMILAGLLRALFRRGIALLTTSNLAPHELYSDGLQRQRFLPAIELIESRLDVVHLDAGIDYRLRALEQAPTYLDARDPSANAALAARFEMLAGRTVGGPATLSIEGRALAARAAAPGVAWFDFAELCAGPRSANDYIEIARRYGAVFLSAVPELGAAEDDAARRFIMLIDELYDRGVKLVLSAMAPPAALYVGERLKREFERTASRLVEMQSTRYLAGRHRG